MFSMEEKKKIADAVEKVLLELNHPEMPKEKPNFTLLVKGKEEWSYAEIKPNWTFGPNNPVTGRLWNEIARESLNKEPKGE